MNHPDKVLDLGYEQILGANPDDEAYCRMTP